MENLKRSYRWRWLSDKGEFLRNVGVERDGSLWNPNNYPEDRVRKLVTEQVTGLLERQRQRRKEGIKKGVESRQRRRESRIREAARRLLIESGIGDRERCYCCRKHLTDPVSIKRGIGPECWEHILRHQEWLREQHVAAG